MTFGTDAPPTYPEDAPPQSLGPLAAALAKAQTGFSKVTRDKTVTVVTKTGKSYSFAYAPLDVILAAVAPSLSKNGLVIVQMLDEGALVTTLLHESGASLSGRVALPDTTDIQGYGSAVTYLRRYAIQAMLGIAAEDDDDGNRAAGNQVTIPAPEQTDDGGLIGVVAKGTTKDSDLELRETPDGWAIGFKLLANGKGGIKVVARDALAQGIAAWKSQLVGQRVTCWGRISDETFTPRGTTKKVTYQVLALERMQTPDFTLPKLESKVARQMEEAREEYMDKVLPETIYPLRSRKETDDEADEPVVVPGQEPLPLEPLSDEEKAAIVGTLG